MFVNNLLIRILKDWMYGWTNLVSGDLGLDCRPKVRPGSPKYEVVTNDVVDNDGSKVVLNLILIIILNLAAKV